LGIAITNFSGKLLTLVVIEPDLSIIMMEFRLNDQYGKTN